MSIGTFTFVLHSHIPYVLSHGMSPHGTDWLSEAAAETYLPIIDVCRRLIGEGISPKITLGLTPVLVEQLDDESFRDELTGYLESKIADARSDQEDFSGKGNYHMAYLARFWEDWYSERLSDFAAIDRDIVGAFKAMQDQGHIEIMTSSATHGYSPLLSQDTTVQAQVKIGIDTYKKRFGKQPRGYWLPECAYRPRYEWSEPSLVPGSDSELPRLRKGVDEFLAENEIDYFFADSHLLKGRVGLGVYADRFDALAKIWEQFEGDMKPADQNFSPYSSYVVNSSGHPQRKLSVFARDPATGVQVWSGDTGYPGDEWYLEFHKKHMREDATSLGLRYWRISGNKADLSTKQLYEPHRSASQIEGHSDHFVALIHDVLSKQDPGSGIICSTYDTELFGHWWFEGPQFLYQAIKKLSESTHVIRATCSEYLDSHPENNQLVTLPEGSWGEGGFHWIWLNEDTAWVWHDVWAAEKDMQELVAKYGGDSRVERLLVQAARELLLLCASDWPFCISTGGAKEYASVRVRNHYGNFAALAGLIARTVDQSVDLGVGDWKNIDECETRDRLFESLSASYFLCVDHPI